jgi:hypothetical protein
MNCDTVDERIWSLRMREKLISVRAVSRLLVRDFLADKRNKIYQRIEAHYTNRIVESLNAKNTRDLTKL